MGRVTTSTIFGRPYSIQPLDYMYKIVYDLSWTTVLDVLWKKIAPTSVASSSPAKVSSYLPFDKD